MIRRLRSFHQKNAHVTASMKSGMPTPMPIAMGRNLGTVSAALLFKLGGRGEAGRPVEIEEGNVTAAEAEEGCCVELVGEMPAMLRIVPSVG